MTIEDVIKTLHSIEDRAGDFPNMTDCDWIAIAAAKRHLSTLKPNYKNLVYTKHELRDMGFGFDLNGNICTPQEIEERSKKYINYRKNKLIEKACHWLKNYRQDTPDGLGYIAGIVNDKTIEDFRKIMYE